MPYMQPKQNVSRPLAQQPQGQKTQFNPNLARPNQTGWVPPQQQGGWTPPVNAQPPVLTAQQFAHNRLAQAPFSNIDTQQQATQMQNNKQWQQAQAMPVNRPSMLRPLG